MTLFMSYPFDYSSPMNRNELRNHMAGIVIFSLAMAGCSESEPGRMDEIFFTACQSGRLEKVKELMKEGVDVNGQDKCGATPLIAASKVGHTKVANILLQAGADPQLKDAEGWTAMGRAVAGNNAMLAVYLDRWGGGDGARGDDDNDRPNGGDPLLVIAAKHDCPLVATWLLSTAPTMYLQEVDAEGCTALMHACSRGGYELVKLMLEYGDDHQIDVSIRNKQGRTALQLTSDVRIREIFQNR